MREPTVHPTGVDRMAAAAARAAYRGAIVAGLIFVAASQCRCRPTRELVMTVTPGVPSSSGCTEGATACIAGVPVRCSDSGRWWPALPRRADGTQRVCPAGQACVPPTASARVHHCALLADGGAP